MSKKFIIGFDTGNIERDVFCTIASFSEEQMIDFIESIKLKKDDNGNICSEPLIFRYPDCHEIISTTKKLTELSSDSRKLILRRTYRMNADEFLTMDIFKKEMYDFSLSIKKICMSLNRKKIFIDAISNDKYDSIFYNLCFEIISSEEMFDKFLHYNENNQIFGERFTQEDYVFELGKLLGYEQNDIYGENPIYKYDFITPDMLNRYLRLRKIVNVDIKMLGENPFNHGGRYSYSKETQVQIDNDWNINQAILEYVMKEMDPAYTMLEKICHIYIKVCQAMRYNLGYHIKKWGTQYSKKRQESISLKNNEVTCSEFSFICTNIISKFIFNKLDSNTEIRCIVVGKEQHVLFGILVRDKNIRINFDSTCFAPNDDKFDDLGRIKLGLPLIGIEYICDRNDEFKNAVEKVYSRLCGDMQIETEDLISYYEMLPSKKQLLVNFYENINEFLKRMKDKNVVGSELLGTFKKLHQIGYFGNIVYSIVGEDKKMNFNERFKMESPEEILDGLEENIIIDNNGEYFLLRLNQCEIYPINLEELNLLFEEGKMRYFNPQYKIKGIGIKS